MKIGNIGMNKVGSIHIPNIHSKYKQITINNIWFNS